MPAIIQSNTESIDKGNFSFNKNYVYLISSIAVLGGVLFGFDLVIISGTVSFLSKHFQLNEFETGWAVGSINLGAAIGAVISARLSNSLGRKKLLMICALLFAVTGIGTWLGSKFSGFYLF